jgi:hypothetical protein
LYYKGYLPKKPAGLAAKQGKVIYFPKAGTYQNIEEFLTAKANKANKDT